MENSFETITDITLEMIEEHKIIDNTDVHKEEISKTVEKKKIPSLVLQRNKRNDNNQEIKIEESSTEEPSGNTRPEKQVISIDSKAANIKQDHASNISSGTNKVPKIYQRKIRERIIHLLALKPFKKLELHMRLEKEGIRKAEQLLIGKILRDIARLSDNAYSLKSYMWKDVDENWPYYEEQERQKLKLYKEQNVLNLSSSNEISVTANETLSSTAIAPPSESETENIKGLKRTSLEHEAPLAAKRRRISHAPRRNCKNTSTLNSSKILPLKENINKRKTTANTTKRGNENETKQTVLRAIFGNTVRKPQPYERFSPITSGESDDDNYKTNQCQEAVLTITSDASVSDSYQNEQYQEPTLSPITSDESSIDFYNRSQHSEPQTTSTDLSITDLSCISEASTEAPSYDFSRYSTITSIEQRRQYIADFEQDYEEYFPLLQRVEEVRYIFRELPEQLRETPEGSVEYERIKERIFMEYELLNTEDEIRLKQRFDYLETKLFYIKQLVDDYDEKLLTEMAVRAAVTAAEEYLLHEAGEL